MEQLNRPTRIVWFYKSNWDSFTEQEQQEIKRTVDNYNAVLKVLDCPHETFDICGYILPIEYDFGVEKFCKIEENNT